jgi:hypothetical protein
MAKKIDLNKTVFPKGAKACRVPVIVPTADVEDLQEEVFVIWIAIALPPECFDLVVQSFDLSG